MWPLCLVLLSASPELEAGRADYGSMKYAKAAESLQVAARDASAPVAERTEALDLLARARLALGDAAGARAAFEALLALAPMAEDPKGSPKVRAAFLAAKRAAFAPQYLRLQRRPSGADVLEVEVINPWALAVRVELWSDADPTPRELAVKGGRVLTALAPGSRGWLRAVALDGVVLASLGSPTARLEGPPAPDAPTAAPPPPPPLEPAAATERPSVPSLAPAAPPPAPTGWPFQRKLGLGLLLTGGAALVAGIPFSVVGANQKSLGQQWPLNGLGMEESQGLVTSGDTLGAAGLGLLLSGAVVCVVGVVLMAIDWPGAR